MKCIRLECVVVFFLAFVPSVAFAYVDPGTGSLLLQSILAAFVGAFFYVRNFFGLKKRKDNDDENEDEQ